MFERVISQTIQRITRETLRDRSIISLQEIEESASIPDRFKPYFQTEVQWWIHNERLSRDASRRFNYSHPELASLLTYLEQVQARHAQFEREDFLIVLDSAVKLTYNYICRPQTTLKWYIFRGQPVKPLNEVTLRLHAFTDYDYFRTVFLEWVDRKRTDRSTLDAISSAEFERVVRRTDDQILLNCTIEDLLEIMEPLFAFLGEGERHVVPVDALVIFFDDKNIKRLVEQLEAYRDNRNATISKDEFVVLIDEILSSAEGEPEADFSGVYQNDALDDVVREHLETAQREYEHQIVVPDNAVSVTTPTVPGMELRVSSGSVETPAHTSWPANTNHGSPPPSHVHESDVDEPAADDVFADDPEAWIDADDPHPIPSVSAPRAQSTLDDDTTDDPWNSVDEPSDELAEEEIDFELEDDFRPADVPAFEVPGSIVAEDQSTRIGLTFPAANGTHVTEALPLGGQAAPAEHRDAPITSRGVQPGSVPGDAGNEGGAISSPKSTAGSSVSAADVPLSSVDNVLKGMLDPSLERKVIKKIFNRDRSQYDAAIARLQNAENWKAACQVLDDIFIAHDVDPYSRTAIRFTDSIYGRYIPGR